MRGEHQTENMKIQPNQQPPKQINNQTNQTYALYSTKPTNQPNKQTTNHRHHP